MQDETLGFVHAVNNGGFERSVKTGDVMCVSSLSELIQYMFLDSQSIARPRTLDRSVNTDIINT